MKKNYTVPPKEKKEWSDFTKKIEHVYDKDLEFSKTSNEKFKKNKVPKLDLHGFTLDNANREVKNFIIKFFNKNYEKILIITGKGIRSKVYDNPYVSEKLNILKNSVPEFINNDQDLIKKINRIEEASLKDGGEGAIYVFLKKNKKL